MSIRPWYGRFLDGLCGGGSRFARSFWDGAKVVLFVVVFFGVIGGLIWRGNAGCEGDHARAQRVLESAGYTKIEVGGAHARRCGEGDGESNTFNALGPTGKYTEGVVCCSREGCGKGCTIRIEP